jgi:hypothetical protein
MRAPLLLLLGMLATIVVSAAAQEPMPSVTNPPAVVHTLLPHEVVEHVLQQQHDLLLSPAQVDSLTALQKAVKKHQPVYEPTGRTKPPEYRAVRIETPEQALAKAFTILTPQQQHKSLMLFEQQAPK